MKVKDNSQNGQAIIEFALIAILLFVVIFGIIEFALIMYNKAMITNASREGAREGVMYRVDTSTYDYDPLDPDQIRSVVNDYLQGRLVTFGAPFNATSDVTPTWSLDGGNTWSSSVPTTHGNGEKLKVEVNYTYTYLVIPRFLNFGGGALGLNSRTIMRME